MTVLRDLLEDCKLVVYGSPEYHRMNKMKQLDGSVRLITYADTISQERRDLLDSFIYEHDSEMGKTICPRCNREFYYTKNDYYDMGSMVFCSQCVIHLPVEIPEEDLARFMNKIRRRKRIESSEYLLTRPIILKRDENQCVNCDNTEYLEVVHIDQDMHNNKHSNLVTLCPKCRFDGQLHIGNRRFLAKLKKIAEEKEGRIG